MEKAHHTLKNLRIADLEIFITAALLKSLGKSARFHHLSQSAASSAVQRVEVAFGVSLCTHERRQFRLTREGQLFLPRLESWVKQMRELTPEMMPIRFVTTHAIAQIAVPALLSIDPIEFTHKRPDQAYAAIVQGEADIALVLDNSPWKGVMATEIGRGFFQLYSRERSKRLKPVLLPEDQMEVLSLQQSWQDLYGDSIPIKTRIPSWSLIANICACSDEIGFLPDFLAKKFNLHPIPKQPKSSAYRVLAIYRPVDLHLESKFKQFFRELKMAFKK
jgi:DNA-binding transcriptional LysR family regulator